MVETTPLRIVAAAVVLVGTTLALYAAYLYNRERARASEAVVDLLDEAPDPVVDDEHHDTGHAVALDPPDVSGGLGDLLRTWRHRMKAKKLAKKGYVKWWKIGSNWARPQWVKPTLDASGELQYYDSEDDATYGFSREGMLHDAQTGAYVAVHVQGDYGPINLKDPITPSISANRMEEIIQLNAESDAPGFWSRLDVDPGVILAIGITLLLVIGAIAQYT